MLPQEMPDYRVSSEQLTTITPYELWIRRILFYGGIVLWIVLLFLPLSMVLLGIMGEFTFQLPGNYEGSQLRIWMIMEQETRGIAYSYPDVIERSEQNLVVEIRVRYLMWEGEGESLGYCEQYARSTDTANWRLVTVVNGSCQ